MKDYRCTIFGPLSGISPPPLDYFTGFFGYFHHSFHGILKIPTKSPKRQNPVRGGGANYRWEALENVTQNRLEVFVDT